MKLKYLFFIFLLFSCGQSPVKKTGKVAEKASLFDFSNIVNILGPVTYEAEIKIESKMANSGQGRTISEKIVLSIDKNSSIYGKRDLSTEDGFEFHYVNKTYCRRLKYNKFICSPGLKNEIDKRVFELWKSLDGIIKPINNRIKWKKIKDLNRNKWNGTKYQPSIVKLAKKSDSGFQWEKNLILEKIDGEIVKTKDRFIIFAKLSWVFSTIKKDGKKVSVKIDYKGEIKPLNKKIKLPDSKLIYPYNGRKRPLKDRKNLLGDSKPKPLKYLY
jgi:hypothetical protein